MLLNALMVSIEKTKNISCVAVLCRVLCLRMIRFLVNYSPAIVWGIAVSILLLMPSSKFGGVPYFEGIDKMVHCGIFFVLTILIYFGNILHYREKVHKFRSLVVVFLIVGIFAFLTEAAQLYLTNSRSAEWWDIFADFIGIGMAMFAYLFLYRRPKMTA